MSRLVARDFLRWLGASGHLRWLDIGAGTGALSAVILETVEPRQVLGVDPSNGYVAAARRRVVDPRVRFERGDACSPRHDTAFDAVVSGLVLNFITDVGSAMRCMTRAAAPGGLVAAYVWDYADQMQLLRRFWDAAVALDDRARELDEGVRFPLCDPTQLVELWRAAGLQAVDAAALEVVTRFRDFDDVWSPSSVARARRRRTSHRSPAPSRSRCATPCGRRCPSPPTARSPWSRVHGR